MNLAYCHITSPIDGRVGLRLVDPGNIVQANGTTPLVVITRASVFEVERTLVIAILLVVLVVFVFLRSGRATLIPAVVVPTSLIGTFGVMYLLGYSLDNLSLMALTISTGFVVDDAIVVIENVSRHIEQGGAADASCAQRRARSRVHCSFDQCFVGCRVYANPAHGRYRRALVP